MSERRGDAIDTRLREALADADVATGERLTALEERLHRTMAAELKAESVSKDTEIEGRIAGALEEASTMSAQAGPLVCMLAGEAVQLWVEVSERMQGMHDRFKVEYVTTYRA